MTATDYELRHGTWWDRQTRRFDPSELMEGRFTRLLDPHEAPPATWSDRDLEALAAAMTAEPEDEPTPETEPDAEENRGIVAAYTYLGQFVDHDLTFDPASQLRRRVTRDRLRALVDFRTPRFDLDCLYGRGPSEQPYLYDARDQRKLLGGRPLAGNPRDPGAFDLPRGPNGRALIGDPRNDENRIVAQLHTALIRFHNRMVDLLEDASFQAVREQVRWHYQWVIFNDFLPTVINAQTARQVFPHLARRTHIAADRPRLMRQRLELMPVELSVAAYRFGHSMIRPLYRLNETISRRPIFSASADPAADLGGMRPIPHDWAIDWRFYLDLDRGAVHAQPRPNPNDPLPRRPQLSYKIDTSIVNPLGSLPPSVASHPASLPLRNLLRGRDFGLPSGQTVARRLGEHVIPDDELEIGKATQEDPKRPLSEIAGAFAGTAPLWTYVLSEAQTTSLASAPPSGNPDDVPIRLGPVGGRLVAEVFGALLDGDPGSLLHADPRFAPHPQLTRDGRFGLAELINAAIAG